MGPRVFSAFYAVQMEHHDGNEVTLQPPSPMEDVGNGYVVHDAISTYFVKLQELLPCENIMVSYLNNMTMQHKIKAASKKNLMVSATKDVIVVYWCVHRLPWCLWPRTKSIGALGDKGDLA